MKTLFRYGPEVARIHLHRPVYRKSVPASSVRFFGSDGQRLPDSFIHHMMPRRYPAHRLPRSEEIHRLAQVNHYAVRTPDMYSLKKARGRGLGSAIDSGVRHTDEFFAQYDTNAFVDREILRHYAAKAREAERLAGLVA